MSLDNTKQKLHDVETLVSTLDAQIAAINTEYGTYGYTNVQNNGFSFTNLSKDFKDNSNTGYPLLSKQVGTGDGKTIYRGLEFNTNYLKSGLYYRDVTNPSNIITTTNTAVTDFTDRPDGVKKERWATRTIFKFKDSYYKHDRRIIEIPIADFSKNLILGDEPVTDVATLYPYIEEIIMTNKNTDASFIHFMNVQYTDGHCGCYNKHLYNLMICKYRTRYGELNDAKNNFNEYLSIYANNMETELAYIENSNLIIPIPDTAYGEELLNTLWDARIIWRKDAPDRTISMSYEIEYQTPGGTEVTISAISRYWFFICYGNGKYVAVAYGSTIAAYSTDGITWTEVTISATSRYWRSVCYGNGKYVATSGSNIVAYSTDGITWTETTISSTSRDWRTICYGNGKFVAVAYSSTVAAYSTDGITWTEVTISGTSRSWYSVCYGNGKFVVVALSSNIAAYSTDGITWTEVTISATSRSWISVCYGNGKYVTIEGSTIAAYSTNGITWTEVTMSAISRSWNCICYGNGRYVAVAGSSTIAAYSTDGITWAEVTLSSTSRDWRGLCYNNGKFLVVSFESMYLAIITLFDTLTSFNDILLIDDRVCINKNNTYPLLSSQRNNINLKNMNYQITVKNNLFGLIDRGINASNFYIAPFYNSIYDMKISGETTWVHSPQWLFKVNLDYYIGFSKDSSGNLIWGVFDKILHTYYTGTDNAIYPFIASNINFSPVKIIKVPNLASDTDIEFIVYSKTAKYRIECRNIGKSNQSITSLLVVDFSSKVTEITDVYYVDDTNENINLDYIDVFFIADGNLFEDILLANILPILLVNGPIIYYVGRKGIFYNDGYAVICRRFTGIASEVITGTKFPITGTLSKFQYSIGAESNGTIDISILKEKYILSGNFIDFSQLILLPIFSSSVDRNMSSVCYGNGKFVVIPYYSNKAAYSTDGITWTEVTISATDRSWSCICYGNDKFVTLADGYGSNIIAYSTDGITWTEVIINTNNRQWSSICYGNSKYVAVASSYDFTIAAYSTDGITWTEVSISATYRSWTTVCYGNGKYVAVAGGTIAAYSTDGITWTEVTISATSRSWTTVCYGNGKFVVNIGFLSSNIAAYSTDGITWTEVTISSTNRDWKEICYGNGKFIIISYTMIAYSTDGITWTEVSIPTYNKSLWHICYGNDKYIISGDRIMGLLYWA